MREYSHEETSAVFSGNFPLLGLVGSCLRDFARGAAGALMPPAAPAKFVCAATTNSTDANITSS